MQKNEFRSGFVTIIGRPNVGKSTFLNKVVGKKVAIMSDKPQTTRNKILGVVNAKNYQIEEKIYMPFLFISLFLYKYTDYNFST